MPCVKTRRVAALVLLIVIVSFCFARDPHDRERVIGCSASEHGREAERGFSASSEDRPEYVREAKGHCHHAAPQGESPPPETFFSSAFRFAFLLSQVFLILPFHSNLPAPNHPLDFDE